MTDPTGRFGAASAADGVGPQTTNGWIVIDLRSLEIVRANDAAIGLLGTRASDLPAPVAEFVTLGDLATFAEKVAPTLEAGRMWTGPLRIGRRHQVWTPTATAVPHIDGADREADSAPAIDFASVLFGSPPAADMSDLVPDLLTGLPTRPALMRRLERAVNANRVNSNVLAVLFLDLDGLKDINDRYGHETGDAALREAAQRVSAALPSGALAVRYGGDEFVVVHEDCVDIDDAERLADDVLHVLTNEADYQTLSASIGLAVARSGEVAPDEMIRRADAAMYRAKERGGGRVSIFDAEMHRAQQQAQNLRSEVVEAMRARAFAIAGQPIFELATGRVVAVELFLKLREGQGQTLPVHLEGLAGIIEEFGEAFDTAVLERAVALARRWRSSMGDVAPRIHVNVSAQSLRSPNLPELLERTTRSDTALAHRIGFEVDGRELAGEAGRELATLGELRSLGARVVLDGFAGDDPALAEVAAWAPSMVKLSATDQERRVTAGLVRAVSSIRVATCIADLDEPGALDAAVAMGAYAGQGQALTGVRDIERIHRQLHAAPRIGF